MACVTYHRLLGCRQSQKLVEANIISSGFTRFLALLQPVLVRKALDVKEGITRSHIIPAAIHAADRVELFGLDIRPGGIDKLILHINRNDLAKDDARAADLHRGDLAAFEARGRL